MFINLVHLVSVARYLRPRRRRRRRCKERRAGGSARYLPGSHLDLLKSGRSMFLCITSTCPFTVPSFPLEKADVQSRMEMGSYQYNVGLHSDDCWAILLSVTWRTLSVLSVLFLGKLESASHGLWLRRSIQLGIPWKHRFAWEGRGGTGQRNAVIDRQEMTRSTRAVQRNWRR